MFTKPNESSYPSDQAFLSAFEDRLDCLPEGGKTKGESARDGREKVSFHSDEDYSRGEN